MKKKININIYSSRVLARTPRTQKAGGDEKLILDDIRELKQDIDELQMKIDSFGTVGAIRYDKECVQTSPSGDSFEKSVIRLIQDKENLEHMKKAHKLMCANVNLSYYTDRQKEFINLYYFQAYSIRQCSHIMNIKKSALCRVKRRINSA